MAKGKATKKTEATVVRVSAKDTTEKTKKTNEVAAVEAPTVDKKETKSKRNNPIKATGGYFKGAWYELKQVRWPNRPATWSMTAALLGFTAFFAVLILLLDALFKYVFQLILG